MLTRMPRAPCRLMSSSSGLRIAASAASVNYRDLERPTVMRSTPASGGAAPAVKLSTQEDLDYLDIPAFLRRQAD